MSRRRSRPSRAAMVFVFAVCAATACGGEQPAPQPLPELTTGPAPTGQQPVQLREYGPGGIAEGVEWPPACALITDDEVRAVLPQTTAVERRPMAESIEHQPGVESADPYARPRVVAVPERTCEVMAMLPGDDGDGQPGEPGDDQVNATLSVEVGTVGGPDTVLAAWVPANPQPLAGSFGAAECVEEVPAHRRHGGVSSFACRAPRMTVEVTGVFTIWGQTRVRLAGRGSDPDPAVVLEWFRTRVMPELLGVIARRLS